MRWVYSRSEIMKFQIAEGRFQIDCRLNCRFDCKLLSRNLKPEIRNLKSLAAQIVCGESPHEVVDFGELVERRQEDDPQEPFFGRQAKAGSVDAEHAGRVEQRLHVV